MSVFTIDVFFKTFVIFVGNIAVNERSKRKSKTTASHPNQYDVGAKTKKTESSLITVAFCGL